MNLHSGSFLFSESRIKAHFAAKRLTMKHIHSSFFLLCILFFSLSSCSDEEQVLLDNIEVLLPGQWHISEWVIRPSPAVNHFGKILENDTTLLDVGVLNIPPFSTSNLDLNSDIHIPIEAELFINGISLKVQIEYLFLSGLDYFAYLRTPEFPLLNSPEAIFISETRFFMKNHFIHVLDRNTIIIQEASGDGFNRMGLIRE